MNQVTLASLWQRARAWFSGQRKLIIEIHPALPTDQARRRWQALTPRQQEVAVLICQGYTNQQIAETLFISLGTVKTHIRRILHKFNLHSKAELRFLLSVKEVQ